MRHFEPIGEEFLDWAENNFFHETPDFISKLIIIESLID
jgi:hypothetical protein